MDFIRLTVGNSLFSPSLDGLQAENIKYLLGFGGERWAGEGEFSSTLQPLQLRSEARRFLFRRLSPAGELPGFFAA